MCTFLVKLFSKFIDFHSLPFLHINPKCMIEQIDEWFFFFFFPKSKKKYSFNFTFSFSWEKDGWSFFPLLFLFLAVLNCRAQQCRFWLNAGKLGADSPENSAMNSREVALVSAATIFGALASTLAIRFFFTNPKNYFSGKHSSQNGQNGVVSTKTAHSQSPFDPSKRRGSDCSVWYLVLGFIFLFFTFTLSAFVIFCVEFEFSGTCLGMIISWQLRFFQLKDLRILTGRS